MRTRQTIMQANATETTALPQAQRKLRSLTLAWHDEESGDDLTVNVRGSERFLKGLTPLGFVPVEETAASRRSVRSVAGPRRDQAETDADRVSWIVRLARHWKPKSH
ncbi:MAG TPA: hypothetical protein VK843_23065 [Planctomycetota bacterium]|nr:hypothetical protein [Planctomycetota bacterium]